MKLLAPKDEILITIKEDLIPIISEIEVTPINYLHDFYSRKTHLDGSEKQIKLYLPFVVMIYEHYGKDVA